MARTPSNTPTKIPVKSDKKRERAAAADDVLAREVDEAVRQDQMSDMMGRYGKPVLAGVVLALIALAAYLFWNSRQEAALERQSETIIGALDQIEAGDLESGSTALDPIAQDGTGGARAAALMLQAGIAQERGDAERAAELFGIVANDGDTPVGFRDLAIVREVAATFDTRKPADIIARLQPLLDPANPFFGSAGEMVAMAYLEQGKRQEAGDLFAQIAKADDVSESLRSRSRRMAGLLGVDAIVDVDEVLAEVAQKTARPGNPQGGPPPAAAPATAPGSDPGSAPGSATR
ncbi:MAG: tetratricopeptide repeat protein [Pontixanthobacter sp.]